MKKLFTQNAGFTLIEILVAVTIVAISFVVLIQGYLYMSGLVQNMREYQLVNAFAERKLNHQAQQMNDNTAGREKLKNIMVKWRIKDENVGDGVRQVMITVQWKGKNGSKEYQLTTLLEGETQ